MAHNLFYNEYTGQHSFFSVKEKAWHSLGKIVEHYPTSAEALQYAGLNYEVVKQDIYTTSFNCDGQPMDCTQRIKTHCATIRKDTGDVLGVVGKDYEIVQNVDAFSFFDSIVGGDGIQYETAGALGQGERIFITAKLPHYIKVGRHDLIEQYLFLTTSHNGFGSITAAFTPVRIVCNNTLHAALSKHSNAVKIRHTANAKQKLEQAHRLMGITSNLSSELEQLFNRWAKMRITDTAVKKLIQRAMVPNKEILHSLETGKEDEISSLFKNMVNNVFEYAMSSPTQQEETTKGTVFGAYNAITGYFQNVRFYKNEEAKMKSIFLGSTAQIRTQAAFELCQDFTKHDFN